MYYENNFQDVLIMSLNFTSPLLCLLSVKLLYVKHMLYVKLSPRSGLGDQESYIT